MLIDNNYDETLYIVKAFDNDLFIVTTEFPKDDWTIAQYNEWKYKKVINAIPLNSNYEPQTFLNCHIKEFVSIAELKKQVIDEMKFNIEDVTVPFLGGIKNFDFRELMKRFYNVEPKDLWECKEIVRKYVKEVLTNLVNA